MTDADLSKELALALGYAPESVLIDGTICYVYRTHRPDIPQMLNWAEERWYGFDYTDPTVCLPLIKWLMAEHDAQIDSGATMFWVRIGRYTYQFVKANTLEAAIARAVIAVGKG